MNGDREIVFRVRVVREVSCEAVGVLLLLLLRATVVPPAF